mmetsp:Transcript_2766/g.9701  ORF Transcript_2766/g.9701 Transcript_2766/m.9701 type:complete len:208 (+) Transcript_2766:957-1580(+)
MKTKQTLEAEAVSTKDIRAVDVGKNFSKMTNVSGQLTKHTLQSGILGDWQEYLVPVSSMVASSGYAFQLELFLNEDAKVVGSTNTNPATYSLEEVSFDVELVEVSDAIMADINSELANGAQIPLPYKSWRSHQTALSGAGTEHKIDIRVGDEPHQHVQRYHAPIVVSKTIRHQHQVSRQGVRPVLLLRWAQGTQRVWCVHRRHRLRQ